LCGQMVYSGGEGEGSLRPEPPGSSQDGQTPISFGDAAGKPRSGARVSPPFSVANGNIGQKTKIRVAHPNGIIAVRVPAVGGLTHAPLVR